MILTKKEPFTLEEIAQLKEQFEVYIKTVIDIDKKICCAGMDRHFEGEKVLLEQGSKQMDIWGGGLDLETKEIDYNSFINIRPLDNNLKNEIQSESIKSKYKKSDRIFFPRNHMTDQQLLVGSLSNDLFRVANLTQRGSTKAATRFLIEAKRWALQLEKQNIADYIVAIAHEISSKNIEDISQEDAERYLMNGILLQNYALHSGEGK